MPWFVFWSSNFDWFNFIYIHSRNSSHSIYSCMTDSATMIVRCHKLKLSKDCARGSIPIIANDEVRWLFKRSIQNAAAQEQYPPWSCMRHADASNCLLNHNEMATLPQKRTIGWKDPFIVAGTNICVSQYNITKHELSVRQSKVPNRCEAGLLFVRRKCLKGPWSYWTSRSWCSVVVDQEHQICTYTYHTISWYILVLTVY